MNPVHLGPRCPICGEHSFEEPVQCSGCLVLVHQDCHEYAEGCGIYGCRASEAGEPMEFEPEFILREDLSIEEILRGPRLRPEPPSGILAALILATMITAALTASLFVDSQGPPEFYRLDQGPGAPYPLNPAP